MTNKPTDRTILYLAANPKDTTPLRLDEEVKKIEQRLERSKKREQFKLIQKWAVTDDELRSALLDHEPEIVHFSGHGKSEGLILENESGETNIISAEGLAELFELCQSHVKCVLLNACYTKEQADAISNHIPIVIGMKKEIGDKAAIKFSIGFYDALGAGKSFKECYKFGCNAIRLPKIREYLTPIIRENELELANIEESKENHELVEIEELNIIRDSNKSTYAVEVLVKNDSDEDIFLKKVTIKSVIPLNVAYATLPSTYTYKINLQHNQSKENISGTISENNDSFERAITGHLINAPYFIGFKISFPFYLILNPKSRDLIRFIFKEIDTKSSMEITIDNKSGDDINLEELEVMFLSFMKEGFDCVPNSKRNKIEEEFDILSVIGGIYLIFEGDIKNPIEGKINLYSNKVKNKVLNDWFKYIFKNFDSLKKILQIDE